MNKIFIAILILCSSLSSWAQKSHEEILQDFLKQRKAMMEQMMKAFDDDAFFSDDFDDDKLFDSLQKNGISGFRGFNTSGKNVKVEENIQKDGSIDVLITPQNKNVKLDIQTTKNSIVIKSETHEEVKNESQSGMTQSISRSSYSQSVSIPDGYEAKSPVQVGDSIKISLRPSKSSKKIIFKKDDDKKPIGKRRGEETI